MKLKNLLVFKLVTLNIRKGNADKALELLSKISNPSYKHLFYSGICYYELNDLDNACKYLEQAQELKPEYAAARVLADIYLQKGLPELALKNVKPFKNEPEVKHFMKLVGADEEKRNKYIQHLRLVRYAISCLKTKEYSTCIKYLEEAVAVSQESHEKADAYNQMGAVYLNFLKDKDKAEEYFKKAVCLVPKNKTYKTNLTRARMC